MGGIIDLSRRADPRDLHEQMDGPMEYDDLRACLRDIARVNVLTLGYRPTFNWLGRVVAGRQGPLRLVDVGCGYGDLLRRIERWAARRGLAVELTGVDLNPSAILAAREATPAGSGIRWVAGDAYALEAEFDLVVSSLVTHHMTDEEIVAFLRWMEARAQVGWHINDLHRQRVPYIVFGALMRLLPLHRFNRPDGLVSIRRSFVPEDWRRMCSAAGLGPEVKIREFRPARVCVERMKKDRADTEVMQNTPRRKT